MSEKHKNGSASRKEKLGIALAGAVLVAEPVANSLIHNQHDRQENAAYMIGIDAEAVVALGAVAAGRKMMDATRVHHEQAAQQTYRVPRPPAEQ